MKSFRNAVGGPIVSAMVKTIRENTQYLSEIDGAIGDGDHGINMNKGFMLCAERLAKNPGGFIEAIGTLGRVLMTEIGGSMGPLYGTFFSTMAKAGRNADTGVSAATIDEELFGRMLVAAVDAVAKVGGAKPGDKTMLDVLVPARDSYLQGVAGAKEFDEVLNEMAEAAERGKESTREMVAKVGRSARLGERSRGALDAGAVSCALLLRSMADTMVALMMSTD